ncbi:MAG: bifunctional metallophosphatase/5'-nucleotidase [Chloroflexi bacterium]|nr:bifunctional metallophosphatase/5'-nucleotidase [Chloroflexota bacterium]
MGGTGVDKLIILHTNDIHGRIDGLARVATLVQQIRDENPEAAVLYFDAGDVEETSVRLSSLTKGTAMYRLLKVAGCDAGAVGNGSVLRYGYQVLQDHAGAAGFPVLLANLRLENGNPPLGVETRHVMNANRTVIGLVGVTAQMSQYNSFFGLELPSTRHTVRNLAASLSQDGVDLVILISHLGLQEDMELAAKLQDVVNIIIGAHSHDLLPEGNQVGNVLITQAGEYAGHLGRIDLHWNDNEELVIEKASVIPVPEDTPPSQAVLDEVKKIEAEIEAHLSEILTELATDFDYALDCECKMGNLMADALRHYVKGEIGLVVVGQAFDKGLSAGSIKRLDLYDASDSSANPGIATLTGEQLYAVIKKGLDQEFAKESSRGLRGRFRGLIHLSGAIVRDGKLYVDDEPLQTDRTYRVAASDFEFESLFGYVQAEWNIQPEYKVPTIIREALEEYLKQCDTPIDVTTDRVEESLA